MTATPSLRQLFPDNNTVKIYPDDFDTTPSASGTIDIGDADLVNRKTGHFSSNRLAILFPPGNYENINLPIGYWTQVLGLGETPDKVKFTGILGPHAVPANTTDKDVGSLDTFWRSAENFYTDTIFIRDPKDDPNIDPKDGKWDVPVGTLSAQGTFSDKYGVNNTGGAFDKTRGMLWACSQAAPVRRVKVESNLNLFLGEYYSSGGFVGNVDVGGVLFLGSQQQFCIRNCDVKQQLLPASWSTVIVGSNYSGIGDHDKNADYCIEPHASVRVEKPFIFVDASHKVYLGIPKVQFNSSGIIHNALADDEKVVIDNSSTVKVFSDKDSYDAVQQAASNGVHIILSPGIYNWGKTLVITKKNQVVLGIGMATIQAPTDGTPCIRVASGVGGVRISGLSLEASIVTKYIGSTLLQWGNKGTTDPGDASNPGAIHDLFCFVGGRSLSREVKVECMVRLFSGNIVGDNLWLWRADHAALRPGEAANMPTLSSEYHITTAGECKCDTGLEVFGDNVLFHGLAVEHTCADNVIWHGKNGAVYFFQNELPYDVYGCAYKDYAAYRVMATASGHVGKGIGVYSYFRDHDDVDVKTAIRHDVNASGQYTNAFTVMLKENPGIKSVINDEGGAAVKEACPVWVKKYEV